MQGRHIGLPLQRLYWAAFVYDNKYIKNIVDCSYGFDIMLAIMVRFDPNIHNRRSIRLKEYDYAQAGYYFITLCANNRECIFGDIKNGKVTLNDMGNIVEKWYFELENKFKDIRCDEFIIMPNHFHAVIINVGADLCVCPGNSAGAPKQGEHIGSPLHKIVRWFKTMTTNEYIRNIDTNNWPMFKRRLWQRNYYERVIRNDIELHKLRQYIMDNPVKYEDDIDNIENIII